MFFRLPSRLGEEWGLTTSPFVEVTFDISRTMHEFPYAILCERSDDGCRLGVSISKVIEGVRYQWWLEKRTMGAIREANSMVDWLKGEIIDPQTHKWGWDRVAFFGPTEKVRSKEKNAERVKAAEPISRAQKKLPVGWAQDQCHRHLSWADTVYS